MTDDDQLGVQLLSELQSSTGLSYERIGGIATAEESVAKKALPFLRAYFPRVARSERIRAAIFHRFGTPHAVEHLDFLLECFQNEDDALARHLVAQAIALSVDTTHASSVWSWISADERMLDLYILRSLARYDSVRQKVIPVLLQKMDDPACTVGEFRMLAKLEDASIKSWFRGKLESPDKQLRLIAQGALARPRRLPKYIQCAGAGPDLRQELFSTEVDLENLPMLLKELSRNFFCRPALNPKRFAFLNRIAIDTWFTVEPPKKSVPDIRIWLRMEDFDTVHVVITGV